MRIGMLTGGGDCPGLNPAIRGLVMQSLAHNHECVGFLLGWKGLVEGISRPMGLNDVEEIMATGGTILGTSRTNPFKEGNEALREAMLRNFREFKLDALVAIGGDDTLGVAKKLYDMGYHTVGVPKTMDNDLAETDYTFGFDSACSVATESVDRIRDTAKSHHRVMVVEVMGRHAGWVALNAGIAGGADWITIPEVALNMEEMCQHLKLAHARKAYGIVVASEGTEIPDDPDRPKTYDSFGNVNLSERGVGEFLAKDIQRLTGIETRWAVLGHIQRGGPPTEYDRVLATRLGIKAANLVDEGDFGKMASIQGNKIVAVDLSDAVGQTKKVPLELYEEAKALFTR